MDNRIAFGILTILFNSYGVPCFLGIVTCGVIAMINMIKGIILGIQILKMSDEEYAAKKGTFDSGVPA